VILGVFEARFCFWRERQVKALLFFLAFFACGLKAFFPPG